MSKPPQITLTPRETDVLQGVVEGLTNAKIGTNLGISYDTVKLYVHRLRTKLGVKTKTGIAVAAIRNNLI